MFPKKKLCAVLVCSAGMLGSLSSATAQVSGVVRDTATLLPISGALVTLQATAVQTTTDANGMFSLAGAVGMNLVIVAAHVGYFNGSITVNSPASGQTISLEAVPISDDPNYIWVSPFLCGFCHGDQFTQWTDSRMKNTGLNTWVYDEYNGTGTAGGMGGFVYVRDSVHAATRPAGECASCHQPQAWIQAPFTTALGDLASLTADMEFGVSCDVCHKVAAVNESLIGYPGMVQQNGFVTINRPTFPDQVEYGVLGDADFNQSVMRASYQPQITYALCGACHDDNNDHDEDMDWLDPGSVVSQDTYTEWRNSPYGDPGNSLYATCVDCHMPAFSTIPLPICLPVPIDRDPNTVRSHDIRGTSPEYLENAVTMTAGAQQVGNVLEVDVDIVNDLTGHSVPSGVSLRNMILLVEANAAGGGSALAHVGPQVVHSLGGIGNPAQGYYSGLAGKLYANVLGDVAGTPAVLYTEATQTIFDNRIAALATDSTSYSFALLPGVSAVDVRVRLIYRRAFRKDIDSKGWVLDGQGQPLADIAAPHFGHLMEEVTVTGFPVVPPVGTFLKRGDCNTDGGFNIADAITILSVLFAGAPSPNCIDACDTNDDGALNIADAITALSVLFGGGMPLPAPSATCGLDVTADTLGCVVFPPCL
ncbi:MAG: carboxypeptidase-like regulatory domain-containing protein [Planctomycetota bacterium]